MSLLWLGFLALLWCAPVFATSCPTAALSVYEGFGATGCTVGLFTFHDFNFILGAPSVGGPVALTAADINVLPVTMPTKFGLNYAFGGFSVATGQKITYLLTYTVDPPPPIIWGFDLSFDADPPVSRHRKHHQPRMPGSAVHRHNLPFAYSHQHRLG